MLVVKIDASVGGEFSLTTFFSCLYTASINRIRWFTIMNDYFFQTDTPPACSVMIYSPPMGFETSALQSSICEMGMFVNY
jgi:hypothetical protein